MKSLFKRINQLYIRDAKIVIVLIPVMFILSLLGPKPIPTALIPIFGVFFLAALLSPFTQKNIAGIMFIHLILAPLSMTLLAWMSLIVLFDTSHSWVVFFPLYALPVISVIYVMADFQYPDILEKVKVALEYNNAFFVLATGLLAVYSFSTSDFSILNPLSSSSSYISNGFNNKDGFDFLISVLGLPFLVANAFTKAFIEHRLYRVALKGNSTNLAEPSNGDNVKEGDSSSKEVRINEPRPVRTAKVKKETKVKQVSPKKQPPLEK